MGIDIKKFPGYMEEVIKWCVFAVLFAVPFSKSISEIAITLAILCLVLKKIFLREAKVDINYPQIALILFALAAVPSLFLSAFPELSYRAFFTKHLKFIFFYFVIIDTFKKREQFIQFFVVAIVSIYLITIDGLVQLYITGVDLLHKYPVFKARVAGDADGLFRGFPTASFPYPNDLAAWILLLLFPAVTIAIFGLNKRPIRHLVAAGSILLCYLLFFTKTRGAWVAAACGFIFIAITKKRLWLIILLVLVLAAPFILRMEMARYILGTTSLGDRASMWGTSWEIFKQHPVIGNGINTFFRHYMNMRTDAFQHLKGSYAHNCYLQMAADIGIVGLGAFLAMLLAHALSVNKALKKIKDPLFNAALFGMAVGLAAFLMHSASDTNLYSLNLVTLFWTFLGVTQAIVRAASDESR